MAINPSGTSSDSRSAAWLALRSLVWTILCPGTMAAFLPWLFFDVGSRPLDLFDPTHVVGLLFMVAGCALLAACIFEFARSGRGTLSPADPPKHLVVRGLYRYVRNPMYLSVTMILLGELAWTPSAGLAVYWAVWFLAVNLFVIGYEEPTLRGLFGAEYDDYTRRVGRWIPRLPPREVPR
jgi:protein-S-isoprenylcysteine O-methyltransferase Ste14